MKSVCPKMNPRLLYPAVALCALAFVPASAAPYPGCAMPTDNDFKMTTVLTRQAGNLNEPLKMDFDMNADGKVDIYFVEKAGNLRKFDGSTQQVSNLGKFNVHVQDEYGLMGIVLDPQFKTNHNIFVFYMPNQSNIELRLSRITLNGNALDMNSEKILIHFPAETGWHGGGGMAFDASGNLWVGIGDTRSGEVAAPNTNDFRGKTIRIHPEADGSYTVPDGNLFPKGTAKTKPEIYIMGNREPYTLAIDPKTQFVVWGEVGPDGYGTTEEYDLAAKPGNYGFPYFAGNNMLLTKGDGIHATPNNENPAHPTNTNPANTGLTDLPPAIPATYAYPEACAMTGPVYRYNYIPNSPVKMPPQFDGLWFVSDFLTNQVDTMSVNDNGTVGKFGRLFSNLHPNRITDFKVGPDGAFYMMDYAGNYGTVDATSIVRIDYTGTCRPAVQGVSLTHPIPVTQALRASGSRIFVNAEGASELKVWDPSGRTLLTKSVRAGETVDLRDLLQKRYGVYGATLTTSSGVSARMLIPLTP